MPARGQTYTPEVTLSQSPDRVLMVIPQIDVDQGRAMANAATQLAAANMPKLSGASSKRLQPFFGPGYFGVIFQDSYVWYQENGIRAFTMYHLAGKTVPMWIDDPTGTVRSQNPRAQTRTTASGKQQVLIFRKAAPIGQRITKRRKNKATGLYETYDAPASYPGAPGRISSRQAAKPYTSVGTVGGQIARGNVGVRWRHPGLAPRFFLNHALTTTCIQYGIHPDRVYVADSTWRSDLRR